MVNKQVAGQSKKLHKLRKIAEMKRKIIIALLSSLQDFHKVKDFQTYTKNLQNKDISLLFCWFIYDVVDKPGVAGAVLQTAL